MTMKLKPASSADRNAIDNLMQLYIHDLSEFTETELSADGRFEYPYLEFYWQEADRHPFLIQDDENPVGFCLVREMSDPANDHRYMDLAEFFVLRSYRGKGIGSEAARLCWTRFKGNWEVRVLQKNVKAYTFWKARIERVDRGYQEEKPSSENNFQTIFRFTSAT